MPRSSILYAIATDGGSPRLDPAMLHAGVDVSLREVDVQRLLEKPEVLLGPAAAAFRRFQPARSFVLFVRQTMPGRAERFFETAQGILDAATVGLRGFGLDVVRRWPFALKDRLRVDREGGEPLGEDIFALHLEAQGPHGIRAETFGLAKLGQAEITFEFEGRALLDEAFRMCDRLVDWLLERDERVVPERRLSFGFDRLLFREAGGVTRRGWRAPLVERFLGRVAGEGPDLLVVRADGWASDGPPEDLTGPLTRSRAQRALLEALGVTGDAPHAGATARIRGAFTELRSIVAVRDVPQGRSDSGWRFEASDIEPSAREDNTALAELARRAPSLVEYLSLPSGTRLVWDALGRLTIDTARARDFQHGWG